MYFTYAFYELSCPASETLHPGGGEMAYGPLTSGCQSLQTCLAFAFVAILADRRQF